MKPKQKRIGTAKLGSIPVTIFESDEPAAQCCYAYYDVDKVEIHMQPGLKRGMFVNSLLHELVHASLHMQLAGVFAFPDEAEEAICRAVSHGLAQNVELLMKLAAKKEAEK